MKKPHKKLPHALTCAEWGCEECREEISKWEKPPKENWDNEEISLMGLILLRNKIRQETLKEIIEIIEKETPNYPWSKNPSGMPKLFAEDFADWILEKLTNLKNNQI